MITYGSFNGLVYAGRDVVAVGTGGSLTGTIVADRNIGQHAYYDDESDYDSSGTTFHVTGFGDTVFAYGTINAAFYALNTTSSVIGGRIGSVQAVDAISGVIQAANEIGPVASGSTVSATLNAPVAPTPIENATYLISQSAPTVPASVATDVKSDANAARDEVLSDRAAIDQAIIDLSNDMSLLTLQTGNEIARAVADQIADDATESAAAMVELNTETATAQGKFASASNQATQQFASLEVVAAWAKANVVSRRDDKRAQSNAATTTASTVVAEALSELTTGDSQMSGRRTQALADAFAESVERGSQWWKEVAQDVAASVGLDWIDDTWDGLVDWWNSSPIIAGVFTGVGHGALMVVNQATFELISPLDDYVDRLKLDYGGLYVIADGFAFVGVNAAYAARIPNLETWAKNPRMYELGSTALPERLFKSLEHLTAIDRGEAIYRQLGWPGFALARHAALGDWLLVGRQGLTPGASLGAIGIADIADEANDAYVHVIYPGLENFYMHIFEWGID